MRPDAEDLGFLKEFIIPPPKESYIAPPPHPDPLPENKDNDGTGHK